MKDANPRVCIRAKAVGRIGIANLYRVPGACLVCQVSTTQAVSHLFTEDENGANTAAVSSLFNPSCRYILIRKIHETHVMICIRKISL